ncbi:penicillin-binding protein 1A [Clostridium acetobutylicum]|uniref:penicillin-binding protein 1A n=1 Tax=Clostridium TaxID=1485 RepID=UPI000200A6F0|nr:MULTISPECIES: penicillin-binding protein 1A [Clostridium]ADZ21353.1 Membrane carboxypeptidase mrcB [Clostridium acetobutylicum EA 2018]AEI34523.1 membrane carboxypeptidase mrcB [Clostridium acetobutylicum DSM 1731]AWV79320.1 penicillin-binding protein 1A [Clostridium acetobutylicum]MBC2394710.1 penicillin-binding protein 1A [Clostridium acetobutylicum]MBC2585669.1 penicillin-binding protein 1A [Clostridium acetobutylicum]
MSDNTKTNSRNKSVKRTKKVKKKKKFGFFKKLFTILFCLFILLSVAASGVIFAIVKTSPNLDINGTILNLDQPSQLYDDNNNPMDTVVTNQRRYVVSIKDMPKNLSNAFVSIEDERFYKHSGIDTKRILGAFYNDIKSKIHKQNSIQGASTITQQLIKNRMFLNDSLENRISFKRKIQEAYLSIKLEQSLSKSQILEAYMNTIFLGGQANGVEAASRQYFNKSAKDLNLIECAFIAGLAQSPSAYYPFSQNVAKNPNIYLDRTKLVLYKMRQNNYIDFSTYQNAINDLNNNKLAFSQQKISNKYTYEWFSIPVVNQVKQDLKSQYHYTDEEIDSLLRDGGLKIYTTMNTSMESNVQNILDNNSTLKSYSYADKNGIIQPEAAATLFDYHTGEIKAIVGGRGQQPPSSYNRADSSNYLRSVGSSIKPLTVYAPAIDTKLATEDTIVNDSPLSSDVAEKYGSNGVPYNPHNDDGGYSGPVNLKTALTKSINLVAIKLEDKLGLSTGAAYAQKFGLTLNNDDKSSIAALSLGEIRGSNTTTMAAAYGVFGNNGLYSEPRLYRKVVDKTGKVLLENNYSTRKVISPQSAYIMYDLLKGPVSAGGTGSYARFGDMPVAGKTGTASDSKNLWFCGLTPYYSAAVWVGNDQPTKLSLGSNDVAEIWGEIMKMANVNLTVKDIDAPGGVTKIGDSYYIDGTSPSNLSGDDSSSSTASKPQTPTTNTQNNTNNNVANPNSNNTTNSNTSNSTETPAQNTQQPTPTPTPSTNNTPGNTNTNTNTNNNTNTNTNTNNNNTNNSSSGNNNPPNNNTTNTNK